MGKKYNTNTLRTQTKQLTENLLKKPPFRFLHDVVSEVTRNTGFGEGLYSDDELNSGNIKDKDSKVSYLTKIINCVGLTLAGGGVCSTPVPRSPFPVPVHTRG